MLQKIKNSYFFSNRFFSLVLVFFISFSVFCFSFGTKKVVKANPLIGVAESELAPIIINILSSFGVVISIPTARDFLEEEKDFCTQKALELQNHEGAVTKGIQALKEGYYVSKEFVSDVLQEWEQYQISKGVESEKVGDVTTYTFPSFTQYHGYGSHTEKEYYDYYLGVLKNVNVTIPLGCYGFYLTKKDLSGDSRLHLTTSNSKALFENLPQRLTFSVDVWNEQYGYKDFYINHTAMVGFDTGITGLVFDFGSYVTKPQVDKKVIDNVLEPVNSQSQGMVISPQNVEAVGKVLDPSIPDVSNSSVSSTAPISSVGATSPSIVNGSDVGALPWEMGGESKPIDGTDSKPVDGTDSKPVDGTDSKPVDGFLGFLQSILDILKQILAWLQGFFDAFLEFLKHLLVPREGYFVDTFNNFKKSLDGKFGIDTGVINNLKDNSNVVEPNFIYKFIIFGVPVVLDLSFIKRAVPYCHIFFGGLTAIFLCWFNLKNILFFIRGTSYISPTGDGKGER